MELKKLLSIVLCSVLLYVTGAEASNIQVPQTPLYNYKNSVYLQEEFTSGATGSGAIGVVGFGVANGSVSYVSTTDVNRPGILRRDTTAVINTIATLQLSASAFVMYVWSGAVVYDETWIVKLNTNDTDTYVALGITESTSGSIPPTNGAYLEKAAADTNWFCVNNNVAGITRTDTGIAVTTNWVTIRIVANASGTTCLIDGVSTVNTSNIITTAMVMMPNLIISNIAAASKTIDIDYWQLIITGLSR